MLDGEAEAQMRAATDVIWKAVHQVLRESEAPPQLVTLAMVRGSLSSWPRLPCSRAGWTRRGWPRSWAISARDRLGADPAGHCRSAGGRGWLGLFRQPTG